MSVHSTEFENQIKMERQREKARERQEQRLVNPLGLTDAGVTWLIWIPIAILAVGLGLLCAHLDYLFLTESTKPVSDFQLPTI